MSGEHEHPDIEARIAAATESIVTLSAGLRDLTARSLEFASSLASLDARLAVLEAASVAAKADRHVSPTGSDTADGLTRATAWKSLTRAFAANGAPAGSTVALWGGTIEGAALYDRALTLVSAPGELVQIRGLGRYSLRLQRAHGSRILPGPGSVIRVLPPATIVEPPAADGTDPGAVRQAAVEITDSNDLHIEPLYVVGGTDFSVLATNVLRSRVILDVSQSGDGCRMKGNLGVGADRSWFGGKAHDINRMIRATAVKGDDYGAVGWVFDNSVGGGLLDSTTAERCFATSPDYVADGGGFEAYDATDAIVRGTAIDCEGGFETGGSAGKGCHRLDVKIALRGDLAAGITALNAAAKARDPNAPTIAPRSPGFLLRSFADSSLDVDVDITRARCIGELYTGGSFSGSIERSRVHVAYRDNGVPLWGAYSPPASTTVTTEVLA